MVWTIPPWPPRSAFSFTRHAATVSRTTAQRSFIWSSSWQSELLIGGFLNGHTPHASDRIITSTPVRRGTPGCEPQAHGLNHGSGSAGIAEDQRDGRPYFLSRSQVRAGFEILQPDGRDLHPEFQGRSGT